jgi:hypothetical protein
MKKGMRKLVNYVRERVGERENIYHEPWKLVSLQSFVNVIYFPSFHAETSLNFLRRLLCFIKSNEFHLNVLPHQSKERERDFLLITLSIID